MDSISPLCIEGGFLENAEGRVLVTVCFAMLGYHRGPSVVIKTDRNDRASCITMSAHHIVCFKERTCIYEYAGVKIFYADKQLPMKTRGSLLMIVLDTLQARLRICHRRRRHLVVESHHLDSTLRMAISTVHYPSTSVGVCHLPSRSWRCRVAMVGGGVSGYHAIHQPSHQIFSKTICIPLHLHHL